MSIFPRLPDFPLRFKIVFLVFTLMVAVATSVAWLFSQSYIQDNITLIQELNFEQAQTTANQLQEELLQKANHLRLEAKDLFERQELAKDSEFTYLGLFSPGAGGLFKAEKELFDDEQRVSPFLTGPKWSSALLQAQDRSIHMFLAGQSVLILVPYFESNGEFAGRVIAGTPRSSHWMALLEDGVDRKTYLVDSRGSLVSALKGLGTDEDFSQRNCVKAFVNRQLNNGQLRVSDRLGGVPIVCTFRALSVADVGLISELSESSVFLSVQRVLYRTVLTSIIVFCFALIFAGWLSRSITQPIAQLAETADVIAKGEFEPSLDIAAGIEVSALARAFKKMIHELKARQNALIDQEKLATAGRMARNIGHEFGNLLQPMIIKLDYIQQQLGAEHAELVEQVEELIQLATLGSGICGGLMTLAREQPDAVKFNWIPVERLLKKTVGLLSHEIKVKAVKVEISAEPELQIHAVEAQIMQVLINLSINSMHAMQTGGRLKLLGSRVNNSIRIVVEDNGSGIAPENLKKIFEPLFTTKGAKGNGLGLSIAKSTLENHGGSIEVESQVGVGTKMILNFPAQGKSELKAS